MKAVREPRGPVSLPRVLSSSLQLLSRAPAATVVDKKGAWKIPKSLPSEVTEQMRVMK